MKIEVIEDYKPIIAECYAGDEALINKWHQVAGSGLQSCVDKEFSDLRSVNVEFYRVTEGETLIGYFCKEEIQGFDALTGFFLMPSFRTNEMKLQFWQLVESNFNRPFFVGLYEKNLPAKKYIESKGGTPFKRSTLPDGDAVLYKVN